MTSSLDDRVRSMIDDARSQAPAPIPWSEIETRSPTIPIDRRSPVPVRRSMVIGAVGLVAILVVSLVTLTLVDDHSPSDTPAADPTRALSTLRPGEVAIPTAVPSGVLIDPVIVRTDAENSWTFTDETGRRRGSVTVLSQLEPSSGSRATSRIGDVDWQIDRGTANTWYIAQFADATVVVDATSFTPDEIEPLIAGLHAGPTASHPGGVFDPRNNAAVAATAVPAVFVRAAMVNGRLCFAAYDDDMLRIDGCLLDPLNAHVLDGVEVDDGIAILAEFGTAASADGLPRQTVIGVTLDDVPAVSIFFTNGNRIEVPATDNARDLDVHMFVAQHDDGPMESVTVASRQSTSSSTTDPPGTNTSGTIEHDPRVDPLDEWVEQAPVINQRTLPNGMDVEVRRSNDTYADLFGIEWDAPTGTARKCLGDAALFVPNPGADPATTDSFDSAWSVVPWWDDIDQGRQVHPAFGPEAGGPAFFVVKAPDTVTEVAVLVDATEVDRARVANGVAIVTAEPQRLPSVPLNPALDSDAANAEVLDVPTPTFRWFTGTDVIGDIPYPSVVVPDQVEYENLCTPGPDTGSGLPFPGEQPDDSVLAADALSDRVRLLFDPSIALTDKPVDLLDDATGVATTDQGANSRTDATTPQLYLGMVSFIAPDDAWFTYSILTASDVHRVRFGRARLVNQQWQFTRATLCQDIAAVGGTCGNTTPPERPPGITETWIADKETWIDNRPVFDPAQSQCVFPFTLLVPRVILSSEDAFLRATADCTGDATIDFTAKNLVVL